MPEQLKALRSPTAWMGLGTIALVLFFWFRKGAGLAPWKHLAFGLVLGLVVVLVATTVRPRERGGT